MALTETERTAFAAQLARRQAQLRQQAADAAEGEATVDLDQTRVGRLSRMDALQAQQMAKETARRRDQELRAIGAALRRIDDGSYGECAECGEDINPRRLEVNPAATHCIGCAR